MGGAETLVTEYALQINKDIFEIVIVTISERISNINEKKLEMAGIKIIFLGDKVSFPKSVNIIKRILNKIQRYFFFVKVVRQEKPDVIHTHLGTNEYLLPINTKKIKLFHTIHGEVKITFSKVNNNLPTKYCIKRKGMIPIALHSKMQKETNDFFNIESCIIVPNSVDIDRFINVKINKKEFLKSLKIKKDAFVIGHVGRFAKSKNHEFLIKVFAALKEIKPNTHLILIGEGELEGQIKEQVEKLGFKDDVSFLGNRGDIPRLMSIMNVFVFPSLYEGFGNVLIEAQASGVKCIVSDRIPSDAFITNLAIPLSLDDKIDRWSQIIVKNKYPDEIKGNLEKYDMKYVIKDLEKKYLTLEE